MAGSNNLDIQHITAASAFMLIEGQFPPGSIIPQGGGDAHFQPDKAILDPTSRKVIAYIETPSEGTENSLSNLGSGYVGLRKRMKQSVPVLLILPSQTNHVSQVRVFLLSSEGVWDPMRSEDFPTFSALESNRRSAFPSSKIKERSGLFLSTAKWIGENIIAKIVVGVLTTAIIGWFVWKLGIKK
jgi:hypothetical protein